MQELNHELVSRGVLLAMERGARERELMSIMIASFSGTVLVVAACHVQHTPFFVAAFVYCHGVPYIHVCAGRH